MCCLSCPSHQELMSELKWRKWQSDQASVKQCAHIVSSLPPSSSPSPSSCVVCLALVTMSWCRNWSGRFGSRTRPASSSVPTSCGSSTCCCPLCPMGWPSWPRASCPVTTRSSSSPLSPTSSSPSGKVFIVWTMFPGGKWIMCDLKKYIYIFFYLQSYRPAITSMVWLHGHWHKFINLSIYLQGFHSF